MTISIIAKSCYLNNVTGQRSHLARGSEECRRSIQQYDTGTATIHTFIMYKYRYDTCTYVPGGMYHHTGTGTYRYGYYCMWIG